MLFPSCSVSFCAACAASFAYQEKLLSWTRFGWCTRVMVFVAWGGVWGSILPQETWAITSDAAGYQNTTPSANTKPRRGLPQRTVMGQRSRAQPGVKSGPSGGQNRRMTMRPGGGSPRASMGRPNQRTSSSPSGPLGVSSLGRRPAPPVPSSVPGLAGSYAPRQSLPQDSITKLKASLDAVVQETLKQHGVDKQQKSLTSDLNMEELNATIVDLAQADGVSAPLSSNATSAETPQEPPSLNSEIPD